MFIFQILVSIVLILYIVFLIFSIYVWHSMFQLPDGLCTPCLKTEATLLVPVRNESTNLAQLIEALNLQVLPKSYWKVIFIDDHSSVEEKFQMQRLLQNAQFRYEYVHLSDTFGKKSAIEQGVYAATTELIVCTDADCNFGPEWLAQIVDHFEHTNAMFTQGMVFYTADQSFWQKAQQIEFASLVGVSAVSIATKNPTMANAANMWFRKSAFLEIGGYGQNTQIASGDDEFLLFGIHQRWPQGVYYCSENKSAVYTTCNSDLAQFFNQRLRWVSKWPVSAQYKTQLLAIFIFAVNVCTLGAFFIPAAMPLLAIRWFLDGLFLKYVLKKGNLSFDLKVYVLLIFIYPWYAVFFGLASFSNTYSWKNRKFHVKLPYTYE